MTIPLSFALPSQIAGPQPHENNCVLEKHFQAWKTRIPSLYWGILLIADSYLQISDLCIDLIPLIGESATNSSIHTWKKRCYASTFNWN